MIRRRGRLEVCEVVEDENKVCVIRLGGRG
jgi:hypothetical protein